MKKRRALYERVLMFQWGFGYGLAFVRIGHPFSAATDFLYYQIARCFVVSDNLTDCAEVCNFGADCEVVLEKSPSCPAPFVACRLWFYRHRVASPAFRPWRARFVACTKYIVKRTLNSTGC